MSSTPGYPEPLVRCREADSTELMPPDGCASAGRAYATAVAHGWTTRITYAKGQAPDAQGEPGFEVDLIPQANEGGGPVLTPTGKQAVKEQPSTRPLIVDSLVLRADRGDQWVRAAWERAWRNGEPGDWKFDFAYSRHPSGIGAVKVKSNQMTKILKGAPEG
jgi:hypothetical protein